MLALWRTGDVPEIPTQSLAKNAIYHNQIVKEPFGSDASRAGSAATNDCPSTGQGPTG
jgi:hypothetical protein